jgi:UDPglucose 6-dehydrogenase
MVEKIRGALDGQLSGRRIAVFGVTFKPNTDDMRDAPSLTIVPALIGAGAEVRVCDPEGQKEGEALLPGAIWIDDAYECAAEADALVVITEWNQFRGLDLDRLAATMRGRVLVDLRNIYLPAEAEAAGFRYTGIGR